MARLRWATLSPPLFRDQSEGRSTQLKISSSITGRLTDHGQSQNQTVSVLNRMRNELMSIKNNTIEKATKLLYKDVLTERKWYQYGTKR